MVTTMAPKDITDRPYKPANQAMFLKPGVTFA